MLQRRENQDCPRVCDPAPANTFPAQGFPGHSIPLIALPTTARSIFHKLVHGLTGLSFCLHRLNIGSALVLSDPVLPTPDCNWYPGRRVSVLRIRAFIWWQGPSRVQPALSFTLREPALQLITVSSAKEAWKLLPLESHQLHLHHCR